MTDIRYDEYSRSKDGLPFDLRRKIFRSAEVRSAEANWHENIELQRCVSGKGVVIIDGQPTEFSVGNIVAVSSGAIHYTGTAEELVYDVLILDPTFCRQAGFEPSGLLFKPHINDAELDGIFDEITQVYEAPSDICRQARLQILTLRLMILLIERHCDTLPRIDTIPSSETVKSTIRFIRENYSRKLSLDEIAANVYTDKYVLSRTFKALTKQTIVTFINQYRCRKAMELISSGTSVSEAAFLCGFTNMSFFTDTFRRYLGVLPSAFKKNK